LLFCIKHFGLFPRPVELSVSAVINVRAIRQFLGVLGMQVCDETLAASVLIIVFLAFLIFNFGFDIDELVSRVLARSFPRA